MRQSTLFTKSIKEIPKDEVSLNAQLLLRAGFIFKEMAGVYTYLPLGYRVFERVKQIIREEMNAIGAHEMQLSALQDPALWQTTGRWDDDVIDVWFKTKLRSGSELGLAFTHEDPLTRIMSQFVHSYKDLPRYVYQIQTKFRNEARAKSGILRCREFQMKDMYSFSKNKDEHDVFYEKAKQAYQKVYERCGIGDMTYLTYASGGTFSKYSHEFQTLTSAGEDTIFLCEPCSIAINNEIFEDLNKTCPECGGTSFREEKAIEVGNIFPLAERFSKPLGLAYADENGEQHHVYMGSYGIGPGRVMGAIVEALGSERSMLWPGEVAPFAVHMIALTKNEDEQSKADAMYETLLNNGIDVLFDDRAPKISAGEKFADSDLIGIPVRLVVSSRSLEQDSVEVIDRIRDTSAQVPRLNLLHALGELL